jgi:hypothetical protein
MTIEKQKNACGSMWHVQQGMKLATARLLLL